MHAKLKRQKIIVLNFFIPGILNFPSYLPIPKDTHNALIQTLRVFYPSATLRRSCRVVVQAFTCDKKIQMNPLERGKYRNRMPSSWRVSPPDFFIIMKSVTSCLQRQLTYTLRFIIIYSITRRTNKIKTILYFFPGPYLYARSQRGNTATNNKCTGMEVG